MQVNSYLYQSPSTSAVQVGRLDPSSKQDTSASSDTSSLDSSTNESLQDAKIFSTSQQKEITPSVNSGKKLDVYA